MLAGMALDFVLLALAFGGRALTDTGPDGPFLGRFLAALSAVLTLGLFWQFCVFMRTDLYAVMVNALGCTNLWRVTMFTIARRLRLLSTAARRDLARASPRDLRVARWYSWLCVAGLAVATWMFVAVIIPTVWRVISSTAAQATTLGIASPHFWFSASLATLALLPRFLTLGVFARQVLRWIASRRGDRPRSLTPQPPR